MLELVRLCTFVATLRMSECSLQGQELSPLQSRSVPTTGTLNPALPSDTVYAPYEGTAENLFMIEKKFKRVQPENIEACKKLAIKNGADIWHFTERGKICHMASIADKVCRKMIAMDEDPYFIRQDLLTDGSDNDDPFPYRDEIKFYMANAIRDFDAVRVMTPTITKLAGFARNIGNHDSFRKSAQSGRIFTFGENGKYAAIDSNIVMDPSCYTNNTCGVPFLSVTPNTIFSPHLLLDQSCGKQIDVNNFDVFHILSHTGIGCKFFPETYPVRHCELLITSNTIFTASLTLVNFWETTCGGYELNITTSSVDGVTNEVDLCSEEDPTDYEVETCQMLIKFSGTPTRNWDRYGFIIKLEKVKYPERYPCQNSDQLVTTQNSIDELTQNMASGPTENAAGGPTQTGSDGSSQIGGDGFSQNEVIESYPNEEGESFQSGIGGPSQSEYPESIESEFDGPTQSNLLRPISSIFGPVPYGISRPIQTKTQIGIKVFLNWHSKFN